jgi:hypothetical protein
VYLDFNRGGAEGKKWRQKGRENKYLDSKDEEGKQIITGRVRVEDRQRESERPSLVDN